MGLDETLTTISRNTTTEHLFHHPGWLQYDDVLADDPRSRQHTDVEGTPARGRQEPLLQARLRTDLHRRHRPRGRHLRVPTGALLPQQGRAPRGDLQRELERAEPSDSAG